MGSKHYWSRLPCILPDQAPFPLELKEGLTGSRGSHTAGSTASADSPGDSPEWKASGSGARGSVATACDHGTRPEEHQDESLILRSFAQNLRLEDAACTKKRSEAFSGRFYIGHTENLPKRIFEHNNNGTLSIKPNAEHAAVEPWHLVVPWFHG